MYYLRGENEAGDPVLVMVETCWRCICLVNLSIGSMEDHADRMHPPQHRESEDRGAHRAPVFRPGEQLPPLIAPPPGPPPGYPHRD